MRLAPGVFFLLLISPVQAAFTDFSDYTQYEEFEIGEVFSSKNLSFRVVDFASTSVPAPLRIIAGSTHAYMIPGPGAEFLLPPNTREISFQYGAGYKISINGEVAASGPIYQTLLDELNGTTLGGVLITTYRDIPYPMGPGYLTLRGPISSLIIAGVELDIDDITVRVPEPATIAILLAGLIPVFSKRR